MSDIVKLSENIGKEFSFKNSFSSEQSVILEEVICYNNILGEAHLFKVFYLSSDGNYKIRYVPKENIDVKIDSYVSKYSESDLLNKYKWKTWEIKDYWYNFVNS